jgi:hypothetical protein
MIEKTTVLVDIVRQRAEAAIAHFISAALDSITSRVWTVFSERGSFIVYVYLYVHLIV